MFKTIFGIIALVVILIVIVLGIGPCIYYGFIDRPGHGVGLPEQAEATHSFYIENTGGLVYASDFEVHGTIVGKRLYVLHGFWELRGKDFKYNPGDIPMDEQIFGEITVKRRSK